ncbi:uncharacterized protein LOC126661606 [Mercurialis annua]|uniref:uncharacterized protein LOC126661606 n=1 Tax=Mercurialis annua TaxID=3986 RepID=UPI00215FF899|nr:uncharacterized protein LOC126661606 [Mercurialis annua]
MMITGWENNLALKEKKNTWNKSDSPLVDFIISHKFPTKFKYPSNMESYYGIGCPKSHIHKFHAVMYVQTNLDHVLWKLYPTTLKGLAQECPVYGMHSLEEVVNRLAGRHAKGWRKYIERFNKEAMQIEDLSQEIAYTAMLNGTTNSNLGKESLAKSPKSFTALMIIAHTQIQTKEGSSSDRRNGEWMNERPSSERRYEQNSNDRFKGKRKKDEERPYTPLNTRRSNVLFWVKDNREKVRWPEKMNAATTNKSDNNKYCEFHRNNGHTTNECWHLKEEIEKLIERGAPFLSSLKGRLKISITKVREKGSVAKIPLGGRGVNR